MSHAQEGQTRLWFPPALVRVAVCLLGRGEVALQAMNLALLVTGLGGDALVHRLRAPFLCPVRFFERVSPRALKLQDLGAMHQARPGEADQVGLLLAPLRQGRCPLARAAQLVRVLAAEDDTAIDHAADDRRQLARGDGHHRLVHQPETLRRPAEIDQQDASRLRREGEQVRIAEALPDLGGVGRDVGCRLVLAGGLVLEDDRKQQITPFHAVARLALDQPLRAAEPSGRAARLSSKGEMRARPERATSRAKRLAGVEVGLVGTLEAAQVV